MDADAFDDLGPSPRVRGEPRDQRVAIR
jgi:hypothetical protein